jgi:hypothetical protein
MEWLKKHKAGLLTITVLIVVGIAVALLPESWAPRVVSPQTRELYQVQFDGCEYIVFRSYPYGGITHKGNCSNPIHGGKNAETGR